MTYEFIPCSSPFTWVDLCGYAMTVEVEPPLERLASLDPRALVELLVDAMPSLLASHQHDMWGEEFAGDGSSVHWREIEDFSQAERALIACCWADLAYAEPQMPYDDARDLVSNFLNSRSGSTRILTNSSLHEKIEGRQRASGFSWSNIMTHHTFEVDFAIFTEAEIYLLVFVAED